MKITKNQVSNSLLNIFTFSILVLMFYIKNKILRNEILTKNKTKIFIFFFIIKRQQLKPLALQNI